VTTDRVGKERMRRYAWRKNNAEKHRAHQAVHKAVLTGRLIRPSICSQCGKSGIIQAHHEDHSKHFKVIWLCTKCHRIARSLDLEKANENWVSEVLELVARDFVQPDSNTNQIAYDRLLQILEKRLSALLKAAQSMRDSGVFRYKAAWDSALATLEGRDGK
jgi:ribosomal protein S27AE